MPPLAHLPSRNQCAPIFRFGNGIIVQFAVPVKRHATRLDSIPEKLQAKDPKAGFVWKHNALRHSFISYRVAQTQNVAQVALEAGNSPRVVFSN